MARRLTLIAGLLLAVLAGHGLVLEWLGRQALAHTGLRLMAAPMFTRLLAPEAPPPSSPAPKTPPPQIGRIAPALVTAGVAPSLPAQATSTSTATAEAPLPLPPPPPVETARADADSPPTPETASEPAAFATPDLSASSADAPAASPTTQAAGAPGEPPKANASNVTSSEPASATQNATATPSPAVAAASTPVGGSSIGSDWPVDTRLNYRVEGFFRGELHGSARVQWQREEQRYQTRIDIDLGLVSLVMTSQGEVSPQGLVPQAYEEVRAGRRRTTVLRETSVVLSDGNTVARPDGVQDTASQFVELSHRFSTGQLPLAVGQSVSFWMARPGGVDHWTYDIAGREVLQLPPFGPVEAFHLKPRPLANSRGNITAEMWFAPSLQYLPVRLRVTTGEAHLDLFVEKIEQR